MRKLFASLFVIIVMFIPSVCAHADGTAFEITSPESVNSGRSFDISIKYVGDEPLGGVWLETEYDDEYFSFKSFSAENCTSDYENKGGKLSLICLFNDPDNHCREMKMTFTSKTGVPSAKKSFRFNCVQAVTSDLKDTDTTITPSFDINVIRKSDGTDTDNVSSRRKDSDTADKNNNTGTGRSTESKTSSAKSKKESYGKSSGQTKSIAVSSENSKEEMPSESSKNEYSQEVSSSLNKTMRLYEKESKSELVIAGAVGALAVVGILFGLYKLGKMENRR